MSKHSVLVLEQQKQAQQELLRLREENSALKLKVEKYEDALKDLRDLDIRIKPGVQWVCGHVIKVAEQALNPNNDETAL